MILQLNCIWIQSSSTCTSQRRSRVGQQRHRTSSLPCYFGLPLVLRCLLPAEPHTQELQALYCIEDRNTHTYIHTYIKKGTTLVCHKILKVCTWMYLLCYVRKKYKTWAQVVQGRRTDPSIARSLPRCRRIAPGELVRRAGRSPRSSPGVPEIRETAAHCGPSRGHGRALTHQIQ